MRSFLLGHSPRSLGFVPTMGALHEGHLSLIEASKAENELTVCSIFVNPIQFNNRNDLHAYPRSLQTDLDMLEKADCHAVFIPAEGEMYPSETRIRINFEALENNMEGKYRPGHFNGVSIVVSKLLNIIKPTRAYFGQKDLQQFRVVSQLVRDLSFDTELRCCPTKRETDGLAMSSRNMRLTPEERVLAPKLHEALQMVGRLILSERNIIMARKKAEDFLNKAGIHNIEYLRVVDGDTLEPMQLLKNSLDEEVAICIAAYIGDVRLIDNILITIPPSE
jgi:pantoate--beta-alanine ligase